MPFSPIFQKRSKMGVNTGIFKPNSHNIENRTSLEIADSKQILHSHKDHQLSFVGGPSRRTTNRRWRTADF